MFFRTLLLSVFLLVIKHAQAQSTLPSSIQHQVESQDVLVMVLGQPIAVADVLPSEDVRKQMREGANGNYAEMLSFAVDMNASNKVLEQLLNDYASKRELLPMRNLSVNLSINLVAKIVKRIVGQQIVLTRTMRRPKQLKK